MTNSTGVVQNGLVLRLSVPTSGELAALGPELAARVAGQLGTDPGHAARVSAAIAELSTQVKSSAASDVEFEFHKLESQLTIVARCDGRSAETRIPLSA
jgi:hypothetical protein